MAKISPLYSSSRGNSILISAAGQSLLVDIGVSCKKMLAALSSAEVDPKSLAGICITHEHIDHVRGLKIFTKQNPVPIYATAKVLEYLLAKDMIAASCKLIAVDNENLAVGDMQISSFCTPHDSIGSVGYRIETTDGFRFAVATDIGTVTPIIEEKLSGCDVVVLESNYDKMMLKTGSYPYCIKQRISSSYGHLSNDDCADFVGRLIHTGTNRFVLAHLSQENNFPRLAHSAVSGELLGRGYKDNVDFKLLIASPEYTGQMLRL